MIVEHKDFKISYLVQDQKEKIEAFLSNLRDGSLSILCKTSGSTGTPRQIEISKKSLAVSAQNSIDFFKLKPKETAILCMSIDFIAGKMMLVRAMMAGLELKVLPVSSSLSELIEASEFIALFPKQLQGLISTKKGIKALKKSRCILVGGATISTEIEQFLISNHISIYHSYGMTETATHVALKRSGYKGEQYYKAVSGVSFSQKKGCLSIMYPKIQVGPITTNDLVELINPFTFKWIGRSDFVINTGGYKVSPETLEEKIEPLLKRVCMVTGIKDEEFGEKIGLILLKDEILKGISKETFSGILHPFEIPKVYVCIHEFSQTSNGKIDRVKTAAKIKSSAWKNIL